LIKEAVLENLEPDSVNVLIVEKETITDNDIKTEREASRWRAALQNTAAGRIQLQEILVDYPDSLEEVLAVWGDKPTVFELEPPEPDEATLASEARAKRNALLEESDRTQLRDTPDAIQQANVAYRQALRDLPGQPGFPFEIVWPVAPN